MKGKQLGRPKGSKDKVKRSNKPYIVRELKKRIQADEEKGIISPLTNYIK